MATEIKAKYRARDGAEFNTLAEAKAQENLLDAEEAFESARKKLMRATAQTQKTADGEAFDFYLFTDYWFITPGWAGMPDLRRVRFDLDTSVMVNENGLVCLLVREEKQIVEYGISSLYKDYRKLIADLQKERRDWLQEKTQAIEECEREGR